MRMNKQWPVVAKCLLSYQIDMAYAFAFGLVIGGGVILFVVVPL